MTSIDGDIFRNNSNLHVLNIAHNQISTINQEAFKSLKNLRGRHLFAYYLFDQPNLILCFILSALRLDNNELKDINGLVSSQKNLKWLNVSTNQIQVRRVNYQMKDKIFIVITLQWFDFAFIPKSLEWLDIHNNKIDKIGNYYTLGSGFSLQTFDASFNQISELGASTLLHGLRSIYLNNNQISKIAPESFHSLSNLSRVELQNNQMISLVSDAVLTSNTGKQVSNI